MNRTIFATLISSAVGLSACGPMSPDANAPSGGPEVKPSLAMLGNSRERFETIATGCPGSEDIAVTVFSHWVAAETVDADGTLHVNGHIYLNFQGEGIVSGAKYVGVVQDKLTATFPAGTAPPRSATEVYHGWLIGQGGAPNLEFRTIWHITVTPDETVKTSVHSVEIDC
ncbi:MAG TPA: hypothetical protein VJQ79_14700 [Acidimicrobiia bacterium]|nr:hypothetical protein [Acidimicrobiia bacterium]